VVSFPLAFLPITYSVTNIKFVFQVKVRSDSISKARRKKQLVLNQNRMCRECEFQKDKIEEIRTELI
jgi:hypothetical protein